MANHEYIRKRDALIPRAENIADKKHGAKKPKDKKKIEKWAIDWNSTFFSTMDKLWEAQKRKDTKQRQKLKKTMGYKKLLATIWGVVGECCEGKTDSEKIAEIEKVLLDNETAIR